MGDSQDTSNVHSIDEVFTEVSLLRDLFARRLMDDKVKNAAIEKLSESNMSLIRAAEEKQVLDLAKELILICDRITNQSTSDAFAYSIMEEILEVMARRGIEQIRELDTFDPRIHNSVSVVEATEELPANSIVAVVRHGYVRNGKVIRAADVVVAVENRHLINEGR